MQAEQAVVLLLPATLLSRIVSARHLDRCPASSPITFDFERHNHADQCSGVAIRTLYARGGDAGLSGPAQGLNSAARFLGSYRFAVWFAWI